MVIKNSTPWSTEDMRTLFRRCVKLAEAKERPRVPFHKKNKHFTLDILNAFRHGGCNGRATINGFWVMVRLSDKWSQDGDEMSQEHKESLAQLMTHEYYHSMGYRSIDKNNYKQDVTKTFDYSWVSAYPIKKKPIVVKAKQDVGMVRYENAIKNLRKAETRLKRAKTIWKKWNSKVNYYSKKYNSK